MAIQLEPPNNGSLVATPSLKNRKRHPRKTKHKKGRAKSARLFPALTLEEALKVPHAIRQYNAGNPWPPGELANVLKLGVKAEKFFYLAASSRDYGLH